MFEDATEVCHGLSSLCDNLPKNEICVSEEIVAIMYDCSTSTYKVHPYNGPSSPKAARVEHIKRSVLQAQHTTRGLSLCKL